MSRRYRWKSRSRLLGGIKAVVLYWNPVDRKFHMEVPDGPPWAGNTAPAGAQVIYPDTPREQTPEQPTQPAPVGTLGSNLFYQFGAGALESVPTVREGPLPTTPQAWISRGVGSFAGFGAATQAASLAAIAARKNPALAPFAPGVVPFVTFALMAGPMAGKIERHEPVTPFDVVQSVLGAIPGLRAMGVLRGLNLADVWKIIRGSVGTLLRFVGDPRLAEELVGEKEATGSFRTLKDALRPRATPTLPPTGGQVPPLASKPPVPAPEAPNAPEMPPEPKPTEPKPPEPKPTEPEPTPKQAEETRTAQRQTAPATRRQEQLKRRLDREQAKYRQPAGGAAARPKTAPSAGKETPTTVQRQAVRDQAALQQGEKPQGRPRRAASVAPSPQIMPLVGQLAKNPEAVAGSLVKMARAKGDLRSIEPILGAVKGAVMQTTDPKRHEALSTAWFTLAQHLFSRVEPLLNTPAGRAFLAKAGIKDARDLARYYDRLFEP
jgi:hypothetical protein